VEVFVDPEFRVLIRPLEAEEREQLEQKLLRDGCRDPLVVWRNGKDTLLDGHHRLEICRRNGIKCAIKPIEILPADLRRPSWLNRIQTRACRRDARGRRSFTRRKTSLRFSANAVILTLSRGLPRRICGLNFLSACESRRLGGEEVLVA
jgi:hypothetical protein